MGLLWVNRAALSPPPLPPGPARSCFASHAATQPLMYTNSHAYSTSPYISLPSPPPFTPPPPFSLRCCVSAALPRP